MTNQTCYICGTAFPDANPYDPPDAWVCTDCANPADVHWGYNAKTEQVFSYSPSRAYGSAELDDILHKYGKFVVLSDTWTSPELVETWLKQQQDSQEGICIHCGKLWIPDKGKCLFCEQEQGKKQSVL